ncbi:MAG TPA: alpha/beta hydrolase [Ohtaekwangia sp.]|nr:alpha/beta hydrolase [Ohtaekwangia sp.]
MSIKNKLILIPAGLMMVLMIFMHSCMTFRMSPKEVNRFFAEHNVRASQHQYKSEWRDIHYVQAGDDTKPLVLFVHGSPGSLSAFIDYLADSALLANAFLITTDRPGFGYSNFGTGEPSLKKQGEALKPIVDKYKVNKPVILVGHSLGGPLIAQMAVDYPDLIDGLIIVAGSIDPDLEPNETWFRAPLATPFLRWVVPRSFRASNDEIYQLKPELRRLLPYWKTITCPVIIIHGKKDSLVPYENVAFARKMLVNAQVEYLIKEDMNHFVPWSNPELIKEAVLRLLEQ